MHKPHPRSGAEELSNFSTGLVSAVTDFVEMGAKMVAGHKPVEERYSGTKWDRNSVLAGDEGFQKLRAAIDDQAAVSEEVRKERNVLFRKQFTMPAGWMANYGGPAGIVAGLALKGAVEAFIAVGNFMSRKAQKKDEAAKERGIKGARRLWEEWRILPPTLDLEAGNVYDFADRVDALNAIFDSSEKSGAPWKAEWKATMDGIPGYKLPIAQDASNLGWIPIDGFVWLGNGYMKDDKGKMYWKGLGIAPSDLKFGEWRRVTKKPGFGSAARTTVTETRAPTLKELTDFTDKYAAGVGALVAARYDVAPEPVIEAAVDANRKYAAAIGPNPQLQAFRLKGVFEKAVEAAKRAPKNPALAFMGTEFKGLKLAPTTNFASTRSTNLAPTRSMDTLLADAERVSNKAQNLKIAIGVGVVAVLAAGGYYWYRQSSRGEGT